jgi:SH3-like domain-containing protein
MTFRNDPPANPDDELPPWLRDDGDDAPPPPPTPPASPRPLKKLSAQPPAAPEDESLPPWLRSEEKTGLEGVFDQQSWLASGDRLAQSFDTELTYDDWAAVQAEIHREKSIEEEIPDLSTPVPDAPTDTGPLGTGMLNSGGELPDWFLGLESLDTSDAPEWFTGTGTGILEEEPPVELPPEPPHPEKRPDSIASFFASLQEVPVYDEPDPYNPFTTPQDSQSSAGEDDEELPELDWIAAQPYEPAPADDSFRGTEMDAFFQSLSGQTAAAVTGELRLPPDMADPTPPSDTEPVVPVSVSPDAPPAAEEPIPDVDWFAAAGLESVKDTLAAAPEDDEPDFGMLFGAADADDQADLPRYPSLPGFDDDMAPAAQAEPEPAEPDEGTINWLSELENIVTSVTTPTADYNEDVDVEEAFASVSFPSDEELPAFNTSLLRDAGIEVPEMEPAADAFDWDAAPAAEEAEHVPIVAESPEGSVAGWLGNLDEEALATADAPIPEEEAPLPKGIDLPPPERPSYKFTGMLVATGLQEPEPEPEPEPAAPAPLNEWGFSEEDSAWDSMFQGDAAPASEETMFDTQFNESALRDAWMTDALVSSAALPPAPQAESPNDDWGTGGLTFDDLASGAPLPQEPLDTAAEPDMSWLEAVTPEDYAASGGDAGISEPLDDMPAAQAQDTSHAFGGFAVEEPEPAVDAASADGDIDWLIAMQSGGELSVETPAAQQGPQQDLAAFESALFGAAPDNAQAEPALTFDADEFGLPTTGMLTDDFALAPEADAGLDLAALEIEPLSVDELGTPLAASSALDGLDAEFAADLAGLGVQGDDADTGIPDAGMLTDNAPDYAWGIGVDASADADGTPDYARGIVSESGYEDLFAGMDDEEEPAAVLDDEALGIGESTLHFGDAAGMDALLSAAGDTDDEAFSFAAAPDAETPLDDALTFAGTGQPDDAFDFNAADMFAASSGADDNLSDALDGITPDMDDAAPVTDYALAFSEADDDYINDEEALPELLAGEEPARLPDTGTLTGYMDDMPRSPAAKAAAQEEMPGEDAFAHAAALDEETEAGFGMDAALDDALYAAATLPDDYTSAMESALETETASAGDGTFAGDDSFDWQSGLSFDDLSAEDEQPAEASVPLPGWVQANEDAIVVDEDALPEPDLAPAGYGGDADELPPDDFFASFGMVSEGDGAPQPEATGALDEFYFAPEAESAVYDESAPASLDWAAIGTEGEANAEAPALSAFDAIAGGTGEPAPAEADWLSAYAPEMAEDEAFVPPAAQPAEAPVYGDLDSYLQTLSIQTGELKPITRTLLEPDADLESLLAEKPTEDVGTPEDYNPFSGARAFTAIDAEMAELADAETPDWLTDVSVGEVSATAIVRQRKDRDVGDLDDRLRKLRKRGETLPTESIAATSDPLASVLPGVEDTLAPAVIKAATGAVTGGIALTAEQQDRVALLRSLVTTVTETAAGEAAAPRESAIDETFDDTYFPDFGDDVVVAAPSARTDEASAKRDASKAQRRAKRARTRARRARRIRSRLERAVLAAILLGAAAVPFVVREARVGDLPAVTFAGDASAAAAFTTIESLQPGAVVLVGIEYAAGSAAELDPAADAVLRHILMRGAYPVVISTSPIALLRAETLLEQTAADQAFLERLGVSGLAANQDYFLVQNLPGGALGLRAFSENTAGLIVNDLRGQVTGLNMTTLRDFAAIAIVSDKLDDIRAYAEQIAATAQAPAIAFVSYSAAPLAEPYVGVNNALDGLVVGYAGAYTYNTLIGNLPPVPAAAESTGEANDAAAGADDGTPAATPTPSATIAAQVVPREDRPAPLLFTPTATFTFTATATSTATPTFTPTNTFTPTLTPTPVVGTVQSTQAVNLRAEPSVTAAIITQLAPGTQVTVIGRSDDTEWYNVQLASGTTGWINRSLLSIPQAGASLPGRLLKPAEQEATSSPLENFANTATAMAGGAQASATEAASATPTRTPSPTRPTGDDEVELRPTATRTPRATTAGDEDVPEATSEASATRTPRSTNTARPTETNTPRPTRTAIPTDTPTEAVTPEATPEATEVVMAAAAPPAPPSPGLRDERWFSITAGILASSAIIGAGALLNIGRSIARRRRAR